MPGLKHVLFSFRKKIHTKIKLMYCGVTGGDRVYPGGRARGQEGAEGTCYQLLMSCF